MMASSTSPEQIRQWVSRRTFDQLRQDMELCIGALLFFHELEIGAAPISLLTSQPAGQALQAMVFPLAASPAEGEPFNPAAASPPPLSRQRDPLEPYRQILVDCCQAYLSMWEGAYRTARSAEERAICSKKIAEARDVWQFLNQ
jgi:hypothetical protein